MFVLRRYWHGRTAGLGAGVKWINNFINSLIWWAVSTSVNKLINQPIKNNVWITRSSARGDSDWIFLFNIPRGAFKQRNYVNWRWARCYTWAADLRQRCHCSSAAQLTLKNGVFRCALGCDLSCNTSLALLHTLAHTGLRTHTLTSLSLWGSGWSEDGKDRKAGEKCNISKGETLEGPLLCFPLR